MKMILVIEDEPEIRRNLNHGPSAGEVSPPARREWSSRRRIGEEGKA